MSESNWCTRTCVQFSANIPARLILYLLSLTCVIVSFALRSVMSISILAMVKERNMSVNVQNDTGNLCSLKKNMSVKAQNYGGTLEWSMDVQYYVLTAFFWTYIIAQVFGAITTQRYGSKVVMFFSLFTSSMCNLCIPLASEVHYSVVIIIQLLHGFTQGLVWPSMYAMISCWIPLHEKSRYVTCFQGLSIGTALSYVQSGYIIAYFGWKYTFYLSAIFGLTWCTFWYFLAFDTPELHPRISKNELVYIKTNRQKNLHTANRKVPWFSIITSIPLWVIAFAVFGRMWIISSFIVYGPMYLKTIIGLEVEMNGLLSGLISLGNFTSALILSYISDKLETYKIVSTIVNRKLFAGIGSVIPSLLCIGISYLHCNVNLIISVWALIQIFSTSYFIGTMVNIIDVAPNFAGHVSSVVQIVLMSPTIFSTFVAKIFLKDGSTIESWKNIFNLSAGVNLSSYLLFAIFATAQVQKWDTETDDSVQENNKNEELQELNKELCTKSIKVNN